MTAPTTGLSVRNVHKRFDGGAGPVVALHEVNVEIPAGSFVTLFGPSGCGKTTLLRILAGLAGHDEGDVLVFGDSPAAATRDKRIAWIPQSSALLPWRTVRDNALLSRLVNRRAGREREAAPDRDVDRILDEMGLGEFGSARPAALSGGMRQRASLARGFVHGAPLMLMDEPFSALDELTRESLRHQLLRMWEQDRKTVVFVTHSAAEAVLLSDRVVVMTPRPGRIHSIVDVDLPRPRTPETERSPAFHEKVVEVRNALAQGWG